MSLFILPFADDESQDRSLEKMCGNVFKFVFFLKKLMTPMPILIPIVQPDMPMFVTSLIYSTESPGPLARVVYALPYIYMIFTWWSSVLFLIVWLLSYVFSTLVSIKSMR